MANKTMMVEEVAKQEDATSDPHARRWAFIFVVVMLVLTTLIPIVFVACACWSNRRDAAKRGRRGAARPGKWWPGRSSDTNRGGQVFATTTTTTTEAIEMQDLERGAKVAAMPLPPSSSWAAPPGSPTPSAGSDTGAIAGGAAFEDINLKRRDDDDGNVGGGGGSSTWFLQRHGIARRAGGRADPMPNWERKTALPGGSSAFQFQPQAADWPRHQDLVLVQVEEVESVTGDAEPEGVADDVELESVPENADH